MRRLLTAYELRACHRFNCLNRHPGWSRLFGTVSRLGDGVFWYALMVLVFAFGGVEGRVLSLRMLLFGVLGVLLYKAVKHLAERPRPCHRNEDLFCTVAPLDRYSFPSGHTLHAINFTVLCIHIFPWTALILIPFALLVMLSRLILGLHYPTDVLAGAGIGATLATIAIHYT